MINPVEKLILKRRFLFLEDENSMSNHVLDRTIKLASLNKCTKKYLVNFDSTFFSRKQ